MSQTFLLHDVFAETARRLPERIAVRLAEGGGEDGRRTELNYAHLHARASRFANYLVQMGVLPGDRVVIYLPRGLDAYWALLGILEAGAAYVPVDWSHPPARALTIARECEARLVISLAERQSLFSQAGAAGIALDDALGDIAALDPLFLRQPVALGPDALAYIIYTSGSTGSPKGVMIRHRNIVFQLQSEGEVLKLSADDIVYANASLGFDMSVEEMWAAFLVGATLLVGSEVLARAVTDLPAILTAHGVTVWCPVPSLLAVIDQPLPSLRLINVGGEACPPELVRRWAPGRRMLNTYGPTETTVTASWAELSPGQPVTIGKPLPGFSLFVVDDALTPLPPGREGELLIGGPAVGEGYWNDPALTAKKFVHPPFAPGERMYRSGDLVSLNAQGDLEFHGRMDLQVKIRGYRVELGEIEAVLMQDSAIAQAAVNLFEEEGGNALLVAFVVPRAGQRASVDALKESVATLLPAYMRPAAYVIRDRLPVTVSGKVDRRALERPRDLSPGRRAIVPPSGALEETLHGIWSALFAPAPVAVTDDFFEDLGGHSLRAAQMVSRARHEAAFTAITIADLYAAPSIRALAARMETRRADAGMQAEPFHAVPPGRYAACVIAQGIASVLVFALSGLQWAFPYLLYTLVATANPATRIPGLVAAIAGFMGIPPVILGFSILLKWIVIGRFRPGDYPLWGSYYFRWWLVRRVLATVPTNFLAGTPLLNIYFRLLGAKVGAGAFIRTNDIDAPDLVSIGDGATIGKDAVIATTCVERGLLRIGGCKIGARASVGVMAVMGQDSVIGDDGMLEDMSALPARASIAPGTRWNGSPAAARGPRPVLAQAGAKPSRTRRILVTLGLTAAAGLLPLAAVLPIAPGLIGMIELDWATSDYSYIALSPLLALTYVLAACLQIVVVKWLLLGRVKAGRRPVWSWFYIRFWFTQQLSELALDLLRPLYATLYIKPWYRALGAKVGARAEISTATAMVHDLVEIGPESFIADGVVFGDDKAAGNCISLEPTRIGKRSFLGNSALIPTGSAVGDDVLIGVLSRPPAGAGALEQGSTWFGLPPIHLPHRQVAVQFDEGARFNPSRRLVGLRLAMEYVRITLPLTGFTTLFCLLLTVAGDLSDLPHGVWWVMGVFPFLYVGLALAMLLFTACVKWLVIGRYRPHIAPLWSMFVWRTELVTSLYENLAVPLLLEPLRGTPFINMALRLLGCRIGSRVFTDTTDLTEFDLITVGDDAALNDGAGLQTHLFEDRVMKVSHVRVGARAVVGSRSIVLYDSVIEDGAQIGDLSVLMKGEVLPTNTLWEGSPARPARRIG